MNNFKEGLRDLLMNQPYLFIYYVKEPNDKHNYDDIVHSYSEEVLSLIQQYEYIIFNTSYDREDFIDYYSIIATNKEDNSICYMIEIEDGSYGHCELHSTYDSSVYQVEKYNKIVEDYKKI